MFLKRTTFVCLAIISFVSIFLVSCGDPAQRHKVLTFFFDGVPPLATEGEMGPPRPDSLPASEANGEEGAATPKKEVWYVHRPTKEPNDCSSSCHGKMAKGEWGLPEFKKKPPELCYDCHDDVRKAAGFMHGPVAAGDCLFCHTPHRSPNKYLLKEKDPDLCYKCHQKLWIMTISQHTGEDLSNCLSCHEGHVGSTISLLRPDWNKKTK